MRRGQNSQSRFCAMPRSKRRSVHDTDAASYLRAGSGGRTHSTSMLARYSGLGRRLTDTRHQSNLIAVAAQTGSSHYNAVTKRGRSNESEAF